MGAVGLLIHRPTNSRELFSRTVFLSFLVFSILLFFSGWLNLSWNESLWTEPYASEKGRLSSLVHGQPDMQHSIDVLSIFGQLEKY